jgi:ankyrin repeat protein
MATSEAFQVDFLEAGTNPNIRGTDAETVLHYAADFGFKEAVSLLIAKKAEIDARNTLEQTPLWLVCANTSNPEVKSLAIAKLLLESGASPNVVSKVADRTPFDEALRKKHVGRGVSRTGRFCLPQVSLHVCSHALPLLD